MHLSRHVKIQLAIFLSIALTAMTILTVEYLRAPALLFGLGQYTVTVELPQSGGLYDRANVTYRGSTVGQVQRIALAGPGVRAELSLNSKVEIPSDVEAQVHSQSAVGEQFIALVPRNTVSRPLRGGDVIAAGQTSLPPDTNDMLNTANTALAAIPHDNLKTLVDESYTAIGGLGPELTRLIDGTIDLSIDAEADLDSLTGLIDNAPPVLDSQSESSDAVGAWAAHLATITAQLDEHDQAVSGLLAQGPQAAAETTALLDRLKPSLPIVLANLVSINDVAIVYQPNIEQLLVLLPQALRQVGGASAPNLNTKQDVNGAYQNIVTNLNLPAPCLTGYLPPSQWRSPVLVDAPDRPPGNVYCRIPQDSPNVVRGARNIPCAGKPWKRAPTVAICESDEEYVPLNDGNNWKGDPNATVTGQDVPQLAPGHETSADGRPPASTPPAALGVADYNPANGTYIGSDGEVYTQANLAEDASVPTLQSMLFPPSAS